MEDKINAMVRDFTKVGPLPKSEVRRRIMDLLEDVKAQDKNKEVLGSFIKYCREHPEQRFWQALRNWSGFGFVFLSDKLFHEDSFVEELQDTFYWEGKDK